MIESEILAIPKSWLLEVWIALPWTLLTWLGAVIACQRWTGWKVGLSLAVTIAAAITGWYLVGRAGQRLVDARLGDLLAQVPDVAPEEKRSPHRVQTIKHAHFARCQSRWGVTPANSGWASFRRSWWKELVGVLACVAVNVHPWWLGV